MDAKILFMKSNVKGHMRGGFWVNPYSTKTTAAGKKSGGDKSKHHKKAHEFTTVVAYHPMPDDNGKAVPVHKPSEASAAETWTDPHAIATWTPGSDAPAELNGIAVAPWEDAPDSLEGWENVPGMMHDLAEPDLEVPKGKKAAAGVIIEEPDGRVWIVRPTNGFGNYDATFPKGTAEMELSLQANAIKEAYEESGLQVEITGFLQDVTRTTSVARFYTARRVGGSPAAMGWESQAVQLVPRSKLYDVLNQSSDDSLAEAMGAGKPPHRFTPPKFKSPKSSNVLQDNGYRQPSLFD